MSYYEQGFATVQDNFTSGSDEIYRCYTYSATIDSSRPNNVALCIVRYYNDSSPAPDKYSLDICGFNKNVAFNPAQGSTIATNISNFTRNNSRVKSKSTTNTTGQGELVCNLPDYTNLSSDTRRSIALPSSDDFSHGFRKTDLPIFTVTNNDFSALNNYIESGDDTGADNYEDLHPTKYVTEVWLDGNFPNIWFKTSVSEGEVETAPSCVTRIDAIPYATPQKTYDSAYTFDNMEFISWSQYQNQSSLPLNPKTPYGQTFELDNNYSSLVQFTWYVDNSGNVSDIQTTDSVDGRHTIVVHEGTPSDTDYPTDDKGWDNITNTYNALSGANTLTKTYEINDTTLRALGNFLWSSTFKDNVLALTNYPLENIVSLKALPLSGQGSTSANIKIGNVDTNITGNIVEDADNIEITVGSVKVPRYFGNFIDYSEVDLRIWLPFIGFKKLDNLVCMDREIRVKYYFDTILGNCLASIEVKDLNGKYLLYDCYQGNCGIDISVASTNRASIENGYINSGLSAISDIVSGNPLGVAKDVFNGMTQDFHSTSTGVGNPSVMSSLDTECRIIVKRPKLFEPPQNYGHIYGYPCYLYVEHLSSLHGFTKCANFVCSLIGKATDAEKEEIKRLLESGIYIF